MILADTSVWVDYLTRAQTRAHSTLRSLIADQPDAVVTCDAVRMEVLAGARNEAELARLLQLFDPLPTVRLEPDLDFRSAADIYRRLRWSGRTIRSSVDCLIAATSLRHGATLWHKDADFVAIASVVPLDQVDLR